MRKVERKDMSFFIKLLIFINMSAYPFLIYSQDVFDRSKIKTKKFPLPKGAIYMDLKYSLPTEEMIGQDIYIKKGASLSTDLDSNIYVADSSQGVIFKFNQKGEFLKKIGSKGNGPGDLLEPQYLKVDNNGNLIIFEKGNGRYQILDSKGAYINSFKASNLFTSREFYKENIFVLSAEIDKKLIEILDLEGKFIDSFGAQLRFEKANDRMVKSTNKKLISINQKGEIFVTWQFFPLVRKYSANRKLLNEFELDYPRFVDRGQRNYENVKNPKRRPLFAQIIQASRAKENGLYILSQSSRIEILEISEEGKIENVYWTEPPDDKYMFKDFIIREEDKKITFYILIDNIGNPEGKINVFEIIK